MEISDSFIVTATVGIIAVMYILEVVKPFVRDFVMKAKSKTPDAYRFKKTTGDFVRVVGLPLSIIVAYIFFSSTLSIGMIVIYGILVAAVADGSYSRLLKSFREQVQSTASTTVKKVVVEQAKQTATEVAAPVAGAVAATIAEQHSENNTGVKLRPEGP